MVKMSSFFHSSTLYTCLILNCVNTVSQNETKTGKEDMIAVSHLSVQLLKRQT